MKIFAEQLNSFRSVAGFLCFVRVLIGYGRCARVLVCTLGNYIYLYTEEPNMFVYIGNQSICSQIGVLVNLKNKQI